MVVLGGVVIRRNEPETIVPGVPRPPVFGQSPPSAFAPAAAPHRRLFAPQASAPAASPVWVRDLQCVRAGGQPVLHDLRLPGRLTRQEGAGVAAAPVHDV